MIRLWLVGPGIRIVIVMIGSVLVFLRVKAEEIGIDVIRRLMLGRLRLWLRCLLRLLRGWWRMPLLLLMRLLVIDWLRLQLSKRCPVLLHLDWSWLYLGVRRRGLLLLQLLCRQRATIFAICALLVRY